MPTLSEALLRQDLFDFAEEVLGGKGFLQVSLLLLGAYHPDVSAGPDDAGAGRCL